MFTWKHQSRMGRRLAGAGLPALAACAATLLAVPAASAAAGLPAHSRSGPDQREHGSLDGPPATTVAIGPVAPVPVFRSWPVTAGTQPVAVTGGPDGNIWYTEAINGPAGEEWGVGRLTFAGPNAGAAGSVLNVTKNIHDPVGLDNITAGPDGNLWATGFSGEIFRVTPAGVASFQTAGITGNELQGITPGPGSDPDLWFADGTAADPGIGRITTHGVVTEFHAGITPDSTPLDITEADGSLWFTEFDGGKIGQITPQGVVTEYDIADGPGALGDGLFSIAADAGYLWVTDVNDSGIYRIPLTECSATLHDCDNVIDIATASPGFGFGTGGSITAGPDGNLWFTEGSGLGRLTPQGQITDFPQEGVVTAGGGVPTSQSVSAGPDGTLWFDQAGGLGEVSFCSPVLCRATLTLGAGSAELSGSLRRPSAIGILVQHRVHGRLMTVGHVPLGHHAGTFEVVWNLRVDGRRLPAGHYVITLRALNSRNRVIDKAVPVTITIG